MTDADPRRAPAGRPNPEDPTLIRAQPALTTSSGAIWLIVGGLFTAIALGVLIPMVALPNGGFALVAAVIAGVVYLGMIVVRLVVPASRGRLGLLAAGMLVIAAVSLTAAAIVATAALSGGG